MKTRLDMATNAVIHEVHIQSRPPENRVGRWMHVDQAGTYGMHGMP